MAKLTEEVRLEVQGLKEAQAKAEQVVADLRGGPFLEGMRNATLLVERSAKKNLEGYRSPTIGGVDTGRLRASITPEVRVHGPMVQGVVGSNVEYAPFVEFDTRPHWPPLKALEVWAERHGTTAYVVAKAIATRGTYGKKYLQRALEDNMEKVFKLIGKTVARIVSK